MRKDIRTDWHKIVEETIKEIISSLDDNISLYDIAEKSSYSPFHFHRTFRNLTGESIKDCVKRLRLERASKNIRETDNSITDIAFDSGYESLESFNKAFKKAFGLTPTRMRKLDEWNGSLYSKAGIHYGTQENKNWFFIEKKGEFNMDIKIVNLEPMKHICVRGVGNYWDMPEKWKKLHELLGKNKLYHQTAQFMTVFHDFTDEVPWEEKRYDVSMTVKKQPETLPEGLSYIESPGGLYAVLAHFGSYEEIGNVWDKWRNEWLPSSGWKLDKTRPAFEWYQNDFTIMPTELLLTLLCDPVIKE